MSIFLLVPVTLETNNIRSQYHIIIAGVDNLSFLAFISCIDSESPFIICMRVCITCNLLNKLLCMFRTDNIFSTMKSVIHLVTDDELMKKISVFGVPAYISLYGITHNYVYYERRGFPNDSLCLDNIVFVQGIVWTATFSTFCRAE